MTGRGDRATIVSLLESDPLRHVVTLKMIHHYGDALELRLAQDAAGWALLSLMPTSLSGFDSRAYPDARFVAMVDGDSRTATIELLRGLPRAPLVAKTTDGAVGAHLVRVLGATPGLSFLSFTTGPGVSGTPAPEGIDQSSVLDPEGAELVAQNGYDARELERYFADGARWFAVRTHGRMVSAGMVFRNFDTIWEIGGLYTLPAYRRQGHARMVVAAALSHLEANAWVPRYVVRSDNSASEALARRAGLRLFLRMDHFVVPPDRQ